MAGTRSNSTRCPERMIATGHPRALSAWRHHELLAPLEPDPDHPATGRPRTGAHATPSRLGTRLCLAQRPLERARRELAGLAWLVHAHRHVVGEMLVCLPRHPRVGLPAPKMILSGVFGGLEAQTLEDAESRGSARHDGAERGLGQTSGSLPSRLPRASCVIAF